MIQVHLCNEVETVHFPHAGYILLNLMYITYDCIDT